MNSSILTVVEAMVQPYLNDNQLELVDIEYVKEGANWFLRLYVDKEEGMDIEDCGKVSEYLSAKLDEADPIPSAYFLEVSSPGVERPLKKPKDFIKALGKHVFVKTEQHFDGLNEFEGELLSYEEEVMVIQIGKKKHTIPNEKVTSARLAIVF